MNAHRHCKLTAVHANGVQLGHMHAEQRSMHLHASQGMYTSCHAMLLPRPCTICTAPHSRVDPMRTPLPPTLLLASHALLLGATLLHHTAAFAVSD